MEKSEKKIKRKYTEEFKREAVELSKKIGKVAAGKELGIHESQIRLWKKKLEGSIDSLKASPSKKSYSDLEKEVQKLTKEIGYLKEINKVLKKSTAILSADLMGDLK